MKIFTRYYYECLQITSLLEFDLVPVTDRSLTFEDYYKIKLQKQQDFQDELREQHNNTDWEEVHRELSMKTLQHRMKFPEYNPEIHNRWFDEPAEYILEVNYKETYNRLESLLPEEIKKTIPDLRILALGFADKNIIVNLQSWAKSIELYWNENSARYWDYIKGILDKLSDETRIFAKFAMHDQSVMEIIQEDTVVKIVYSDDVWGKAFLLFKDAEVLNIKGNIISWWLYDELYITEDGKLELHVLTTEGEFEIKCSEISIEVEEKEYLRDLLKNSKDPEDFYIELNAVIRSKINTCSYDMLSDNEKGFFELDGIIGSLHWTYMYPGNSRKLHKGFDQYFFRNSADKSIDFLESMGETRFLKIIKEANRFRDDRRMLSKLSRRLKYAYDKHIYELYEIIWDNFIKTC